MRIQSKRFASGLILLFVFTMALPAFLLLWLSLELAGEDDLKFEIQMNRILMGRAQEFQAELDSATRAWLKPYLETDWSLWMDSPSAGFAMTVLPAPRAAEIWPVNIARGKFHGEMQAKISRAFPVSSRRTASPA